MLLNRKKLTFVILLLLSILSIRFLPGCGEGLSILTTDLHPPVSEWSLYDYKRKITIQENSGTALSDYQVNIILENDPYFYTHAAANGSDIRFNYNDTSLPYWIEAWDSGGTRKFSVWVKVPSIPSGGETVIYMYYGQPGLAAASDFSSTFTKNFDTAGLVARWHMDEGSGSSVDDSSANSNTGTITGAAWSTSDGLGWYNRSDVGFSTGYSLNFDGSGDYVSVPDNNTLDAPYITIEAWIKTGSDVTPATPQYILAKWDTDGERSYAISIASSTFYFSTSDTGFELAANNMYRGAISSLTWYHVAVTSDGVNKKIYINGTQAGADEPWAKTIKISTSNLAIGARDNLSTNAFTGIIDEVSIYNTALTATEIEFHSKRSKYVNPPPACTLGSEEQN